MAVLLLWIICVFASCVSYAFSPVHCCLVVTSWERASLLALVGDVFCIFVTFPCGILCQVCYLIVSFPDLCRLSYFVIRNNIFLTSINLKDFIFGNVRKFVTLFISTFIRFGSKLYRQIVGTPMGTNCVPLIADLFLFCFERDFMSLLLD